MTGASLTTPRAAVAAMQAAGAVFTTRRREDSLAMSFSYRVASGGDPGRCREILAEAKSKPTQFFEGFKAEVQRIAGGCE